MLNYIFLFIIPIKKQCSPFYRVALLSASLCSSAYSLSKCRWNPGPAIFIWKPSSWRVVGMNMFRPKSRNWRWSCAWIRQSRRVFSSLCPSIHWLNSSMSSACSVPCDFEISINLEASVISYDLLKNFYPGLNDFFCTKIYPL